MSHYRVAVFANTPYEFDDLLAPYNEQDEKYFEFIPLTPKELDRLYKGYEESKNLFDSFEDYAEDYGCSWEDDVIGCRYNPNAKWDWYSLDGGDWQFEMKKGEEYDEEGNARKNQFDYTNQEFSKKKAIEDWNKQKKLAENPDVDENDDDVRYAKYFMQNHPDLNEYLRMRKLEYPWAFITPDGEWHAPGTVGWFAMADDTPESMKKYLDEWEAWIASEENPYVNFVDCHI